MRASVLDMPSTRATEALVWCPRCQTSKPPSAFSQSKAAKNGLQATTGEIRGMLCSNCNVALGMLNEDPDRIRQLLAYIERS